MIKLMDKNKTEFNFIYFRNTNILYFPNTGTCLA